MSEVQATYFSYLGDQSELPINIEPVVPKKKKVSGVSMLSAATSETDDADEKETNGPLSGSEHFIGHLMKYVLHNKIGVLPYKV